jgi:hypothetical protein
MCEGQYQDTLERILKLEENWDDMGGEGFTEETINDVKSFLNTIDGYFGPPKLYPSANGSIDIDWETDDYGLLINISKGGNYATYYADNKEGRSEEGSFGLQSFDVNMLSWIRK